MKIFKYKNYQEYEKAQKDAFIKKNKNVWAKEENIKTIAEYLKPRKPITGICHGVRQGWEVIWFRRYLGTCNIVGTDIGNTKKEFIVRHDFNKPLNHDIQYDFIYSNSFDHAYNPKSTFNIWADQVIKGGLIILEYDRRQEHTGEISKPVNKVDPVSIKVEELIELIPKWRTNSKVIDVLDMPVVTQEWRKAIVIEVK